MSTPTARLSTAAWAERALWALRGSQSAGSQRVSRESLAQAIHFPLLVFGQHLDDVLDVVARDEPDLARMVLGSRPELTRGQHPGCAAAAAQRA